jgi:hypothetical protein
MTLWATPGRARDDVWATAGAPTAPARPTARLCEPVDAVGTPAPLSTCGFAPSSTIHSTYYDAYLI